MIVGESLFNVCRVWVSFEQDGLLNEMLTEPLQRILSSDNKSAWDAFPRREHKERHEHTPNQETLLSLSSGKEPVLCSANPLD